MTNQVTEVKQQAVVEVKNQNYIQQVLQTIKDDFLTVNAGLNLDFVYLADWMRLTKTGQFVDKNNEAINFGNSIDVVIGMGEQRYVLWGKEKSEEDGQLIVAEQTQQEAITKLQTWLEMNPEAVERYAADMISLTYLAYMVPVNMLQGDDLPPIYIMSLPEGDAYSYGQYATGLFKGKYKPAGIPIRTGVAKVITRIKSKEKSNDKHSWVGREFEPVGMFKPEEFGIKR